MLALTRAGRTDLPEDEESWRALLLSLTPDDPDCAAFALISPPDRPALLQAPVPGGKLAGFKPVDTPDELDMLVMSKSHDIKAGALPADDAELWLYALVSLQTQEGFLGAGNYGIARMNGGFASRPGFGGTRDRLSGDSFVADCRRALEKRAELSMALGYLPQGGIALTWLLPWDGATSLRLDQLDLNFIDVCRRVRLVERGGRLVALAISTKAPRIEARAAKGDTGDLWTPVIVDKEGRKAFTADARGWSYQQLVRLMFPQMNKKGETVVPSPLQSLDDLDADGDLVMLGRVLVRGQGKTEGYHERRVPISRLVSAGFGRRPKETDEIAAIARDRVQDAGAFARQVLFPALMAVFSGAPRSEAGERTRDDDTTKSRAGDAGGRFDTLLDVHFFDDLADEVEVVGDKAAIERVRADWIRNRLFCIGTRVLGDAIAAAPDAAARHWRIRVAAEDVFNACFRKQFGNRLAAADQPMPAYRWADLDAELAAEEMPDD
ncbi:hypothetical protein [Pleomorphomonas sp. NRK KF1]|uniref:hypothetical protein n=1 Tax=Pleomorphomonas sp. NRK KF1 TaxID=2943000 RepID=UPI002043BCBD|nr:hypothetical protein [Pleomorphomonas sp. NRK KF1]MCM5552388.1 hypothetical protein [Pleomorphomonas sp. NRK KF1]